MRRFHFTSAVFLAALAVMAPQGAAPALAQGAISYVSLIGSDSNICGFPFSQGPNDSQGPCRSLQRAVDLTLPGSEIVISGPGLWSFSPVTINKSVSISTDPGFDAHVGTLTAGAVIITIDATRGDVVSLRGLTIDGSGKGSIGVLVREASAVHVQNCVIRNFEGQNGWGIVHSPVAGTSKLFVSDTIIYNNGSNPGTGGLLVQPIGAASAPVTLDRVHLENNVVGLWVDGRLSVTGSRTLIRDSVVSANAGDGIIAISQPGQAPAFILAERTTSLNNGAIGIHANGPRATILLNDNTITQNGAGILAEAGGQLFSYGNNKNNNNIGPEGAPTGFFSQM